MKLTIKEWDYGWSNRQSEDDIERIRKQYYEPKDVADPYTRYSKAVITVRGYDAEEDYETQFDFDVENTKKLDKDDFESYVNKNASLLAQQECEIENLEYRDIKDIYFEEEEYWEEPDEDFYDPYE